MKIDRSQDSALEVVESNAKSKTPNVAEQKLSVNLLKIGFENQFQKNESARIRFLINDLLDEYLQNNG